MPLFTALASLTSIGGMKLHNGPVRDIRVGSHYASQSITVTMMPMPMPPLDMPMGPPPANPMFPGGPGMNVGDEMAPPMGGPQQPPPLPLPLLPPLPGTEPPRPMPRMALSGSPCVTPLGSRGITNRRGECVTEGASCQIGACKPGTECQMKPVEGRYNRRGVCVQEGAQCFYGCDERHLPPGAVCIPGPGKWDAEGKCVPYAFVDSRPPCSVPGGCWTPPNTWIHRGMPPPPLMGQPPMPMPMMGPPQMMPSAPGGMEPMSADMGDMSMMPPIDEPMTSMPPMAAGASSEFSAEFSNTSSSNSSSQSFGEEMTFVDFDSEKSRSSNKQLDKVLNDARSQGFNPNKLLRKASQMA